jgi:chromosomal replication initiation ATPase DnaA
LNRKTIQSFHPTFEQVVDSVARQFKVDVESITRSQRGRVDENIPRWIVMYLMQELCGLKLHEIASHLELKRTGSVPTTVVKLKSRMATDDELSRKVERIKSEYDT